MTTTAVAEPEVAAAALVREPSVRPGAAGEVLRRLSRIDILRALPPEEVQAIVPFVQREEYPTGATLMREGDIGDAMYFIEAGSARVQRTGVETVWHVGAGSVVGEAALLTGQPRSATVTAEADLTVWRISKASFDRIVVRSPHLRRVLEEVIEQRHLGITPHLPSSEVWVSTALRAVEARQRGVHGWQLAMGVGLLYWVFLFLDERWRLLELERFGIAAAVAQLLAGLLLIQGSAEAIIHGVERLGARLRWDGFISGTIGSLLGNLPEFVVIAFLVRVEPLAAFVTAAVTVFNNGLIFSVYSFFLPKDLKGAFAMPRSLTAAGGEILIAGGAVTLTVGIVMVVLRFGGVKTALAGWDLIGVAAVLMVIYGYYVLTLVQYYGEGKDDVESLPPDPERLGHDSRWRAIAAMFGLGLLGAFAGGEAIGGFANAALKELRLPTIPTAAALAFFAGLSEYIILFKSHRRGELGIALSNAFGALTQMMFMLLAFALLLIGILGLRGAGSDFAVPINAITMLLMLLLFPLFYALHQYLEQEKSLTNLDAAGLTGIYLLLLYFLFTSPA
ncbi:MAG: cyclic nucleotide-binding domain-containing protein [Gemmatimonadetes bacterium]|nr:cyclic nucleotide-binding domain-containing protein [Gemmatimonadota bacterium]